jgi:hypothetical protein
MKSKLWREDDLQKPKKQAAALPVIAWPWPMEKADIRQNTIP